jgi:ribosomal protein L28
MSRICDICSKKSVVVTVRKKLRSKYNPTTKKRKYPNLQWVKLANGKKVKACAKCIKKLGSKK